jgi:hypothetical protein
MKILNRPMFRYGGPIKEGIMEGIQEPRQGYKVGNKVSLSDQAKAFENIFTTPQTTEQQATQFAKRGTPNLNMGTPKISSFEKMQTNNQFGNQDPTIVPNITIKDKIESYTPNPENPFRGLIDYTKKVNVYVDENGVKRDRTTGKEITDTDYSKVVTEPRGPQELGQTTRGESKKDDIKGLPEIDTEGNRKKSINNILEKLGYARSQKNALYDALIAGGQRISREGLGKTNLVNDLIADTSTAYDKPEKIREAAELMQVQQDLKLEGIEASRTNTTEEAVNFLMSKGGGNMSRTEALDQVLKNPRTGLEAFQTAFKNLGSGSEGKAMDSAIEWSVSRDKFAQPLGKINTKKYDKPSKFAASKDFKGAGNYVLNGTIVAIEDNGSFEIKETFYTTTKSNKFLGIFGSDD